MLAPLSTLLARAKRNRLPLPVCRVSMPQIAEGAIAAAEAAGRSIALMVPSDSGSSAAHTLFATCIWLAEQSRQPIAVLLDCREETAEGSVLAVRRYASMPGLCLLAPAHPHAERLPRGWERLGSAAMEAPASTDLASWSIGSYEDECGLLLSLTGDSDRALASELRHSLKAIKLPLILHPARLTPELVRQTRDTGLAGYLLDRELDDACVAGMRTALRSKELGDPVDIMRKGRQAVLHCLHGYLAHI